MISDRNRRDLLQQVVAHTVGDRAQVEWLESDTWSAHARLQGQTGLVAYLLTSAEWQEARFEALRYSTLLIADGDDEDDVRSALERLATAVAAYLVGDFEVQTRQGLFGTRTTLNIHSQDGLWRVGKRTTTQPPPLD